MMFVHAGNGGKVDYIEIVDSVYLRPRQEIKIGQTLIAVAARFGSVRLIDNIEL